MMHIYKKKIFREFVKFGIVGISGIFVNLIVLYFFTEIVGVFYLISAIFAFLVALTTNFILNKTWTFRERIRDRTLDRYIKYFAVNSVALAINLFFLFILTENLGIYYIFSQVIAIGIAFLFNFAGNKFWTFN